MNSEDFFRHPTATGLLQEPVVSGVHRLSKAARAPAARGEVFFGGRSFGVKFEDSFLTLTGQPAGKAVKGDEEALNGEDEAVNDDGKALNGDEE